MTIPTRAAAVVLLLAGAATACSGADDQPGGDASAPAGPAVTQAPVALDGSGGAGANDGADDGANDAPTGVTIGLLLAGSTAPGQGQDVAAGAQGAALAAYRLGLGDADVTLAVQRDDGTSAGARAAVQALLDAGVAGIVVGSTGDHLTAALADASAAGTAVLLPYDRPDRALPDGVFLTGPDAPTTTDRLADALGALGVARPFVVRADGVDVDGVGSADAIDFRGLRPDRLLTRLRAAAASGKIDGVLLAASAATQADLVARLQGSTPDLPIVLSPDALSPDFAQDLVDAGGTLSGRLTTVGTDAWDTTTLTQGERAERAAAFFAALRLAAGEPSATDVTGDAPFADVAAGADTASHDAVLALYAAVRAAGDTAPGAVRAALAGLVVDGSDGLAGPDLDFSSSAALAPDAVVVLQATTQDPGVRPAGDGASLHWFAVPADG